MTKTVIWRGYFSGSSGYTQATKRYPIATVMAGYNTKIMPMDNLDPKDPLSTLLVRSDKDLENSLQIVHQIPTTVPNLEGYFTVTEFNMCPPEWWESLLHAKLILTQSKFCKDIFGSIPGMNKSKIKVVYYPMPAYCVEKGPNLRQKLHFNNDTFIIGSIFEWVARKKPELMWEAFINEFKPDEKVLFLNKIQPPNFFRDWWYRFNQYRKKDPRIQLINGFVEDMGTLYRTFDCTCSPTAGEGWGAVLSESMACGIPTIGSKHSGNLEYMTDQNSWLVDVDPWSEVGSDHTNHLPEFLLHKYQKWRLPKVDSIQKAMREIYEIWKTKEPNKRALEGLKLQELCGMKNISAQMGKALVEYL